MRKIFTESLPKKNGRIDWASSVGIDIEFVYDEIKGKIKIVDMLKGRNMIIEYNGRVFTEKPISYRNLYNCKIAYYIGRKTIEFKYEVNQQIKDVKRNFILIDREYRIAKRKDGVSEKEKWYKYECLNCNSTGWLKEGNLKNGCGCRFCCEVGRKTPKLGINTIWDTDRWMVDLGVSEEDAKKYTRGGSKKIIVTCPNCGRKKNMIISNIYKRRAIGCSCGDGISYLSEYITSVLDQLKVEYQTEVKYDWNKYINPLTKKESQASIDFIVYSKGREIPVEADGGFHRQDNGMSGITAEMQQNIDKQRDRNCLKHLSEETIRISDEGDIKENILNSKLNELFDLSDINWNKCEEFALSNLVKRVCEYWNNKEDWETVTTISKGFSVGLKSVKAIQNYLKKGYKLGWCNYDPKEESFKGSSKSGKMSGKTVEILKDNISLGMFESCVELERQSEELFGIKLDFRAISAVCLGNKIQHKGYTFKYIDK